MAGWQDAVGVLARERELAESGAGLLKAYAGRDAAAMARGQQLYAAAKAASDGLVERLLVAVREGDDPGRSADLEAAMGEAVERRVELQPPRRAASAEARGHARGRDRGLPGCPRRGEAGGRGGEGAGGGGRDLVEDLARGPRAGPAGDRRRGSRRRSGGRSSTCPRRGEGRAVSVGGDGLYAEPFLVLEPGRHTAVIKRLDADREGRFLVTASDDKTVRVWAAEDGRLLRTLRLPAGPGDVGKAYAAAISPDGALVAAGGWTSADRRRRERLPVRPGERAAAAPGRRAAERRHPPRLLARRDPARRDARRSGGRAPDRPRGGPGGGGGRGLRRRQLRGRVRRRGPARDHELRRQGPALRPGAAPPARGRGAGRQAALRDRLLARRRAARGRLRRHDRGRRARRGHARAPVRGRHQGRGQRQPLQGRLVGGRRQPLRRRALAGRRRAPPAPLAGGRAGRAGRPAAEPEHGHGPARAAGRAARLRRRRPAARAARRRRRAGLERGAGHRRLPRPVGQSSRSRRTGRGSASGTSRRQVAGPVLAAGAPAGPGRERRRPRRRAHRRPRPRGRGLEGRHRAEPERQAAGARALRDRPQPRRGAGRAALRARGRLVAAPVRPGRHGAVAAARARRRLGGERERRRAAGRGGLRRRHDPLAPARATGRSCWPSTRTRTGSAGCCGRPRATTTPRPGRRT